MKFGSVGNRCIAKKYIKLLTHLIRKVIRVEEHLHIARLTDEGLRLFRLAAEHAWLAAIGYVGFGIAINNLQQGQQQQRGEYNNKRNSYNNNKKNNNWNFAMWRMAKSNQMISEDDSRHINRGNCKWDWTTRCPGHKAVSQRIRRNYADTYVII